MTQSCQCKLRKKSGNHEICQTAWIPKSKAHVGKFVKIRIDGEWDDGWEVIEVSRFSIPETYAVERSRDYRHQREASDI